LLLALFASLLLSSCVSPICAKLPLLLPLPMSRRCCHAAESDHVVEVCDVRRGTTFQDVLAVVRGTTGDSSAVQDTRWVDDTTMIIVFGTGARRSWCYGRPRPCFADRHRCVCFAASIAQNVLLKVSHPTMRFKSVSRRTLGMLSGASICVAVYTCSKLTRAVCAPQNLFLRLCDRQPTPTWPGDWLSARWAALATFES
jgi:hypothetical protein